MEIMRRCSNPLKCPLNLVICPQDPARDSGSRVQEVVVLDQLCVRPATDHARISSTPGVPRPRWSSGRVSAQSRGVGCGPQTSVVSEEHSEVRAERHSGRQMHRVECPQLHRVEITGPVK